MSPRSSTREVLRRAAAFFAGDSVAAVANAAIFAVLLRRMDPGGYGYFALSYSLSAWVLPLVQMGMTLTGARLVAERPEAAGGLARAVVRLRVGVALVATAAMSGGAWLAGDPTLAGMLLAWGAVYLLTAVQLEFVCVGLARPWVLARSRAIASLSYLAGAATLVSAERPPWVVPLLSAAGLLLGALYQYSALRPSLRDAAGLTGSSWPLVRDGIATTSAQIVQMGYYNVDVPLLRFVFGADMRNLGEYAAATRLLQLAAMPMVALLYAVGPSYSRRAAGIAGTEFLRDARTFRAACLALGIAGGLGIAFVGPTFLETLGGRALPVARQILPILGLAYLFIGLHSPYSAVLTYLGGATDYFRVNLVAFVVSLAAVLMLVPRWGFPGAALAVTLGVSSLLPAGLRAYRRRLTMTPAAA